MQAAGLSDFKRVLSGAELDGLSEGSRIAALERRVFTGDDPLPRSLSARIWQPTAPTTKPFVIAVSGPTFVVRGLLAGEYQVSAHSFEGRTMSSGNGSVGVASGTTTRLPIAWKIRQR